MSTPESKVKRHGPPTIHACVAGGRARWGNKTSEARFHEKHTVEASGCWLWTGSSVGQKFDYGTFFINGKVDKAHRAAYTMFLGPIPEGLCVLHKCDTPACVNPEHLFVGTKEDNAKDMISKNRGGQRKAPIKGSAHWKTELTESDVLNIRARCAAGESQRVVGLDFGIRQPAVFKIVHRQRWGHI